MNAPLQEDTIENSTPIGPGHQLKGIREAQGLELPYVASQLHLSDSVLEALEADNYDAMAGNVFVQGYLRNYARLVGVDVTAILNSFEQMKVKEHDGLPDLRIAKVKHEVRSSHALVRMITWLIVISLVGLLVVWWRGYLQWPLQLDALVEENAGVSFQESDPRESVDASADPVVPVFNVPPEVLGSGSEAGEETEGTRSLQEEPTEKSSDTPAVQDPTSDDGAVSSVEDPVSPGEPDLPNEETSLAATNEMESATEANPTASVETLQSAPPVIGALEVPSQDTMATGVVLQSVSESSYENTSAPSASGSGVVISFNGPCWVEARGANRSYRWLGSQQAGGRLVLEGEAPYDLVFGNASAVSIEINGEAYDLAQHIRANVAKFTLELN